MWMPPDMGIWTTVVTGGVANGFGSYSTVAPAPSAGDRYRLWAVSCDMGVTTQTPARTFWQIQEATSGTVLWQPSAAGWAGRTFAWPGGIPTSKDNALRARLASDVANLTSVVYLYVTTEGA